MKKKRKTFQPESSARFSQIVDIYITLQKTLFVRVVKCWLVFTVYNMPNLTINNTSGDKRLYFEFRIWLG